MNSGGAGSAPIGDIILGICLTLFAQIFSSIQFVFEEKFMKSLSLPPLYLVGWEGIVGAALAVFIFLPACYLIPGSDFGSYENFINSAYMMFTNGLLFGLQFLYFISISFFNFMSLTLSKMLSATHRSIIDALRTCFVWVFMVIMFYSTQSSKPAAGDQPYGEPLTWWSFFQLAGFCFMFTGTVIHNNVNKSGEKLMGFLHIHSGEVACCQCQKKYSEIPNEQI